MRGSGVFQSLKSLASKFHAQLPLSPKESQRLLTALTSSFRQKLDEAHPRQAHDQDARLKPESEHAINAARHTLHTSSVALADRHLASVLTNPLLAKPDGAKKAKLDFESAKRELEQNPDRDPISVLEEYHQKGAATIPIADLCLRTFRTSLLQLSEDARREKVTNSKAGQRTLQWLWTSELYESDTFVDDRRLMNTLVHMVVEEGQEHFLWSWLRFDLRYGSQDQPKDRNILHAKAHSYRWKAYVARCLVMCRWSQEDATSLNAVLDTYFQALDIHLEISQNSTTNWIPLASAVNSINTRIFSQRRQRDKWDPERYDRYIQSMNYGSPIGRDYWMAFRKGILHLTHPKRPSPIPMVEFLKPSFSADPKSQAGSIRRWFEDKGVSSKVRLKQYYVLIETARLLQDRAHKEDMEWVISLIRSLYPENERYLDKDLTTGGQQKTTHVPNPREHGVTTWSFAPYRGVGVT